MRNLMPLEAMENREMKSAITRTRLMVSLIVTLQTGASLAYADSFVTPGSGGSVAYVGGQVWNGEEFAERTLFVHEGRFVEQVQDPEATVDLHGGYVIPPFGDAHTHMLADSQSISLADSLFLQDGVFYVLVLNNSYSGAMEFGSRFGGPATIDVSYAHGGITSTGSHPAPLYERIFGDEGEGAGTTWSLLEDAYWFMDSVADVAEQWSEYIAQDPDVVKVYLMDVKGGLKKGDMTDHGLRPEVLRAVVERAHAAGKRVFAHANTADDFRLALEADVDGMAHILDNNLCSSDQDREKYQLDVQTIRQAVEQEISVITTVWTHVDGTSALLQPDAVRCAIQFSRKAAGRLNDAGISLALGADSWEDSSLMEAQLFHAWDFFDNRTLLNLLTRTTAKVIFPHRKLGELVPGYEASFLSLDCDPVGNFECVKNIRLGVKEGHVLAGSASSRPLEALRYE